MECPLFIFDLPLFIGKLSFIKNFQMARDVQPNTRPVWPALIVFQYVFPKGGKFMANKIRKIVLIVAVLMFLMVFTGCQLLKPKSDTEDRPGPPTAAAEHSSKPEAPLFIYYDFADVPFPPQLRLEPEDSFVYWTGGLKTGLLSLSGWVEADSLCSFFEHYMTKDNWRFLSLLKARPILMLFVKKNRYCVISISDGIKTNVKAWVAPTIDEISRQDVGS